MSQAISHYPEPPATEGSTLLAHRGKLLVGVLVLVGALAYLGFLAFQGATVYYYTVDEIKAIGPTPDGKVVRVSGKLAPGSFTRPEGSTLARFNLTDGSETLQAVHDGILPDLFFNEHSEIILEGTYTPQGTFDSQNIIVKCPSKYIAAKEGS